MTSQHRSILVLSLLLGAALAASSMRNTECNNAEYRSIAEKAFQPNMTAMFLQLAEMHPSSGTWLQIGANTLDPVLNDNDPGMQFLDHFPDWEKYFVEPIPFLFGQLKENVKRWPKSHAINAAISKNATEPESETTMYCLEDSIQIEPAIYKGATANQVCSFNPTHITNHFPGENPFPVQVTSLSFPRLLEKFDISSVKVLLIDAEGFDEIVLRQVPLHKLRPTIVIWEHMHLKPEAKEAAAEYARKNCYAVWNDGFDSVAVLLAGNKYKTKPTSQGDNNNARNEEAIA